MKTNESVTNFKKRVYFFAEKIGVKVKSLTLKPMEHKWASCSNKGILSFNKLLLDFKDEEKDYVIVHELLHLKIKNHGKLWKSLMSVYLGSYQQAENKIKGLGIQF